MDPVLQTLLRNQGEFVSGMRISEEVGLSRTAVWKHVQSLIEEGYGIDCIKKKGYRLHTLPENRWIVEKLSLLCHYPVEWFYKPEVDSTNLWAKEVMVRHEKPSVFFTDKQYAGRGRLGRQWESETGKDIAFSLAVPLNTDVCHYYQYTIMMALAVYRVLLPIVNTTTHIKWPNDIYIQGKKVCGILSEMLTEENRLRTLILGVGINVNSSPSLPHALSLKSLTGKEFDRHIILSEILNGFFDLLHQYGCGDFASIYEAWRNALMGLGQKVRIDTGQKVIEGTFIDINEQGIAIIQTDQSIEKVYSGDLFLSKS
ncbi:Biotin operon repressor / Biotin--protein ligase [Brevinematales bacterium NS]|jgi:BirA family biotin operon repressor/biotin-[acetyl-CoA-carboxylase] ligase|nr:Biotin operon repressor / Biotin--protein ligase [Brevinematales bacterium NS]